MNKLVFWICMIFMLLSSSVMASHYQGEYISLFAANSTDGEQAIVNCATYSEAKCKFYIQPPSDEVWDIHRMIFSIGDNGLISSEDYGSIAGGLTNGIVLQYTNNGVTVNLTNDQPVKENAHWGKFMYDTTLIDWGSGEDYVQGRWTFANSGTILQLNGSTNDTLAVLIRDDLSSLHGHTFLLQGHVFNSSIDPDPVHIIESDVDFTMSISIIIGLLALFAIVSYYGVSFYKMNGVGYKSLGMIFGSIASFITIVLTFVMLELSAGTAYFGLMGRVFQFTWIFVIIGNMVAYFMIFYYGGVAIKDETDKTIETFGRLK